MFQTVFSPFFQQRVIDFPVLTAIIILIEMTADDDQVAHPRAIHIIQQPFHFAAVVMGHGSEVGADHQRMFFRRDFPHFGDRAAQIGVGDEFHIQAGFGQNEREFIPSRIQLEFLRHAGIVHDA